DPIWARSVINASVILSAKNSWDASPLRFSNGSTARDRMTGRGPETKLLCGKYRQPNAARLASANRPQAITSKDRQWRTPEGRSAEGRFATARSSRSPAVAGVGEAPLSEVMKRYPRPGSVSMYRGVFADSFKAVRNRLIAELRLCSKSTNVSAGQRFL